MRPFIDDRLREEDGAGINATNEYIEIELPVNDSLGACLYFIPRTDSSIFVATCWEHVFDGKLSEMDEKNWKALEDTRPELAALINNGINARYREGALIRLEDPDYGEYKWFVVSVAGNLSFDSIDNVLTERTQETIQIVLSRSMSLLTELNENEPGMLRAEGRSFTKMES